MAVHNGHITPATLRWILKLTYGYEYELLGGEEDRRQAETLLAAYTVKTRGVW